MEAIEDPQSGRRFNPLRSMRRGLKSVCRWTIGLGRGRAAAAFGRRRGRRAAPPLASLSAAMLEPEDVLDLGGKTMYGHHDKGQHLQGPLLSQLAPWSPIQTSADEAGSLGSVFPLVLRRPNQSAHDGMTTQHPRQLALHYHKHVEDAPFHHHHHQPHHHHPHEREWSHHHSARQSTDCTCGGVVSGYPCDAHCSAAICSNSQVSYSQTPHSHTGSGAAAPDSGGQGARSGGAGDSLQHLLAVGSRQWGNGGWWDGRGLLRVKIYDFAVYADVARAAHALRSAPAAAASPTSASPSAAAATAASPLSYSSGGGSPAQLLVSPASGVGMSLTIRACRNLPLPLLSQEFERILQRRTEKAGGRADDPALHELLSYFSRERLPPQLVVPGGAASASGCGSGADAVAKGAAITFSRSPNGELVTEAGGRVLGRLRSPALAEALFDLYLGDKPVSKRAKAAAGAALLRMAQLEGVCEGAGGEQAGDREEAGSESRRRCRYRYRLQPGERLLCPPGTRPGDVEACVLEVS